ncbi:hypothetical protein SRABI83_00103 [Arthrobacter sp. Bi83]|nr:hypothetical protein SRABI83_00103 [Arthrobacter sp. Bi83]
MADVAVVAILVACMGFVVWISELVSKLVGALGDGTGTGR